MKILIFLCAVTYSFLSWSSAYHIIDDPKEAISMRMAIVKAAKKSIYSAKFIFKDDEMGLSTLATLREKARALKNKGIDPDIKLLFDSTGSMSIDIGILMHLEKEGIEVRFFNDIFSLEKSVYNLAKGNINYWTDRMHDKLLIVDGVHAISGGRNIQDSYYALADGNYLDRDIYVSLEPVRAASEHFLNMWHSKAVSSAVFGRSSILRCYKILNKPYMKGLKISQMSSSEINECKEKRILIGEAELDKIAKEIPKRMKEVSVDIKKSIQKINSIDHSKKVEFIGDYIDDKGKYKANLSKRLVEIASKAKKNLFIETPYLIPDKNMLKVFKNLLDRGVEITLVTNSLKATDGLQAFAGYSLYRKQLMNLGKGENQMKIYEYQGSKLGKYLHAKSASIDDELALIGSYNLDPRSDKHNTEVLFMADDAQSAIKLRDSIASHIQYSIPLGRNGNPNGGKKAYPNASAKKKIQVEFYRKLLRVPLIGPVLEEQL